jgi:hypothetical protein
MPIHDWTQVTAGTFHDFHQTWIIEIKRALNAGLLPLGFYAMAEQIAGGLGPDVLTLEAPLDEERGDRFDPGAGAAALAIAEKPPAVHLHNRAEVGQYARKASAIAIRHSSTRQLDAMIEIVSPGNKNSAVALSRFVAKAIKLLEADVHLLILDLIPPGRFDPHGIHGAIWQEYTGQAFEPPPGQPLTLASYIGGRYEAYIEPTAVGRALIEMPLFLDADSYVSTPLEATYRSAFDAVPAVWRRALEPR